MAQTINLDEILPEKQKVIVNGTEYELKPLNLEQFLRVAGLEKKLADMDDVDEILDVINKTMSPMIDGFKATDFTIHQLRKLMDIMLSNNVPADLKKADPKQKKTSSPDK